jgi:hypothetical protein
MGLEGARGDFERTEANLGAPEPVMALDPHGGIDTETTRAIAPSYCTGIPISSRTLPLIASPQIR